jgi:hypothetical protein
MTPEQLLRRGILKLLGITERGSTDVVQVDSTCLSEVSYNLDTSTLTVEFLESGARYRYFSVPESDYESLVNNFGSVGEEFNDSIKDRYLHLRIS